MVVFVLSFFFARYSVEPSRMYNIISPAYTYSGNVKLHTKFQITCMRPRKYNRSHFTCSPRVGLGTILLREVWRTRRRSLVYSTHFNLVWLNCLICEIIWDIAAKVCTGESEIVIHPFWKGGVMKNWIFRHPAD